VALVQRLDAATVAVRTAPPSEFKKEVWKNFLEVTREKLVWNDELGVWLWTTSGPRQFVRGMLQSYAAYPVVKFIDFPGAVWPEEGVPPKRPGRRG
jgi:hypothetical protein